MWVGNISSPPNKQTNKPTNVPCTIQDPTTGLSPHRAGKKGNETVPGWRAGCLTMNGPTGLRGSGGHPNFMEGFTSAPGVGSVSHLLHCNGLKRQDQASNVFSWAEYVVQYQVLA